MDRRFPRRPAGRSTVRLFTRNKTARSPISTRTSTRIIEHYERGDVDVEPASPAPEQSIMRLSRLDGWQRLSIIATFMRDRPALPLDDNIPVQIRKKCAFEPPVDPSRGA